MANQGPKRGAFEKVWFVPRLGVFNTVPFYETPDEALHNALNVIVRSGTLQPRPGLSSHNESSLLDRPMGATVIASLGTSVFQADTFQNNSFQVTGAGSSVLILVGTTRRIFVLYAGVWTDITNTLLTGGDSNPVRFASIEISGVIYTIITNGVDTPRLWDSSSATVSNVSGSPPLWTDITTIGDHIVGIIPPYTVRWGNNLSVSTWPALNFRDVADTQDRVVAIRNMGTLGGVLYKEKSIWSVISLGGAESTFYRFELRGFYDGPCSPAAVVDANGVQYYLTSNGRIGRYNGTQHDWVADGVWDLIRADLDQSNMNRAFGVYEPSFDEVYFYYPRAVDTGDLYGMVILKLPRPKDLMPDFSAWPGRSMVPVSCGTDLRFESNQALVFRSDTFKSRVLAGDKDDDEDFSGFWQPGIGSVPGVLPYRIEEIEVFARRQPAAGTLTIKPVTSNLLDVEGGTVGAGISMALTMPTFVRDLRGTDARGRFLGLRFEFTTPIFLRFLGARLTANPLEG